MFNTIKKKILTTQVKETPFPYIFINDLIDKKKLKNLNKVLPNYKDIVGDNILYQSSSRSKKTILPKSKIYKKLEKNKSFSEIDKTFRKLKPTIIKKFEKYIQMHVSKNFSHKSLKYHSSYSVMRKGYKKSPHLDRRDHLIHMIFYPFSKSAEGGEICIHKLKKQKKVYDVFPNYRELKINEKYKVKNNSCIIILNVPWAYHSVSLYKSEIDRKYFYMVYDFPIIKSGSKLKNRKEGFNQNHFWNDEVKVKSSKRKNVFLSE